MNHLPHSSFFGKEEGGLSLNRLPFFLKERGRDYLALLSLFWRLACTSCAPLLSLESSFGGGNLSFLFRGTFANGNQVFVQENTYSELFKMIWPDFF